MTDRSIALAGSQVRALLDGRMTQVRFPVWRFGGGDDVERNSRYFSTTATRWRHVQAGDRLWVREAFFIAHVNCFDLPKTPVPEGGVQLGKTALYDDQAAYYKADYDRSGRPHWRSSRHMPRWASRLTLTVTKMRVERLQEISEADAQACGVLKSGMGEGSFRFGFRTEWDRLHGAGAWDRNPEVAVLTFFAKRQNIDELEVT